MGGVVVTYHKAPLPTPWTIEPVTVGEEYIGKFYIQRLVASKTTGTGVKSNYLLTDGTTGDTVIVNGVSVGHFDSEEAARALLDGTYAAA